MKQSWVLLELDNQKFGYPTEHVREVSVLQQTRAMPRAPDWVRGVFDLRGNVFPAYDLRKLLGRRGYRQVQADLEAAFLQRKQDHVNWVSELRASVEQGREFKLTTDPHKCAFGRWYDAFESPDPVLASKLMQFDRPHQHIHRIGADTVELVAQGRRPEARARIERAWTVDLAVLITLFDQTLPLLQALAREVVVLVQRGPSAFGLIADAVLEVTALDDADIQPIPDAAVLQGAAELCSGAVGRDKDLIFLFDATKLDKALGR